MEPDLAFKVRDLARNFKLPRPGGSTVPWCVEGPPVEGARPGAFFFLGGGL